MTQQVDIIGRYAQLSVAADNYTARGQHPPEHIVLEMQRIYATAEARLSPQQLQAAMKHLAVAKERVHTVSRELQTRVMAHNASRNAERLVRNSTPGMFGQPHGISFAQLKAYIHGRPIPAEGRTQPTEQELDAQCRSYTRQNDPKGIGWGKKETERRLDELVDAGSPEEFAAIVKREGYRRDFRELQKATNKWKDERIEYGLLERRQARDKFKGLEAPKTVEPTDRDKRRATLVNAYLETTADKMESDAREGRVSDEYYEMNNEFAPKETTGNDRRSALARAWNEQQSESED